MAKRSNIFGGIEFRSGAWLKRLINDVTTWIENQERKAIVEALTHGYTVMFVYFRVELSLCVSVFMCGLNTVWFQPSTQPNPNIRSILDKSLECRSHQIL